MNILPNRCTFCQFFPTVLRLYNDDVQHCWTKKKTHLYLTPPPSNICFPWYCCSVNIFYIHPIFEHLLKIVFRFPDEAKNKKEFQETTERGNCVYFLSAPGQPKHFITLPWVSQTSRRWVFLIFSLCNMELILWSYICWWGQRLWPQLKICHCDVILIKC